ncbi:type II secretion system F family protein [Proteinivorax tanatarense]|uniref:Type II secretion system F family protein n=1 Tax=Proteinivorax tanatarense TaxID=1260629 RepID=A0AAU7VKJ9_9FIRM
MQIIMLVCLTVFIYNIVDLFMRFVYRKYITYKIRLNDIQKHSLFEYPAGSKRKEPKERISIKLPEKLREDLMLAGLHLRPEEFILLWGIVTVFPGFFALLLSRGIVIVITLVVSGLLFPIILVSILKKKRMEKFNQQLGEALMVISNSLRAGFTFEQALSSISKDLPDPIGTEFKKIVREVELGEELEKSMENVAKRMESKDMELMTTAVAIQRQVGGNLSNILDNIGETIKDRIIIKRNIKALTAQGEISGKIIALLPVVLLVMISMVNPEYMAPMFNTTYGHVLLGLSIVLEVLGYITIKKLINIEM